MSRNMSRLVNNSRREFSRNATLVDPKMPRRSPSRNFNRMPPKKNTRIPDRWEDYTNFGDVIEGTNIFAMKTPLHRSWFGEDEHLRFTVEDLLRIPSLGLVVDLTYTTRYYNVGDITRNGVKHKKIFTEGHIVPREERVMEFQRTVQRYLEENERTVVGVHCTHGINRSGYIVCRYLMDCLGWSADRAIDAFNAARGHGMEREKYIDALKNLERRNHGLPPTQDRTPGSTTQTRLTPPTRDRARSDSHTKRPPPTHDSCGNSLTSSDDSSSANTHDEHYTPGRHSSVTSGIPDRGNSHQRPQFKAFVGNLPVDCTVADLRELFDGLIIEKEPRIIKRDRYAFGFVEFSDQETLQQALGLDDKEYKDTGMNITVRIACDNQHQSRGYRGDHQGHRRGQRSWEGRRSDPYFRRQTYSDRKQEMPDFNGVPF